MRQELAAAQAKGIKVWTVHFLTLMAGAYRKVERIEEASIVLAAAVTALHKGAERLDEAELYRLRGDLTLQSSARSPESRAIEAEEDFQRALEVSRSQQARFWELRAATSLARLWQRQGRSGEARDVLQPVYDWFTEGFDTLDLKDAKAVLDELA